MNFIVHLRYPTFEDALHDLDDCLALCHLFATFTHTKSVPRKHVRKCIILIHLQLASIFVALISSLYVEF